jgi:RimJ/RimL family protein N-acetyltransferase
MACPSPPDRVTDGCVVLRALTAADWQLEQALSRDPEVTRWTTIPTDLDDATAQARIQRYLSQVDRGAAGLWVIESDGIGCGNAGLAITPPSAVEVFYSLLPKARGRGLATRAVQLMANWALEAGYTEIGLATFPNNRPSQRTACRAGFVETGSTDRTIKGKRQALITWHFGADARST